MKILVPGAGVAGVTISNLLVNASHGTLGWTLWVGFGRAVAEIVSGRPPAVDFRYP